MTQILPVEVDDVNVGLQRQIKRECVVVDDAVFDVIQLTWDTCIIAITATYTHTPRDKYRSTLFSTYSRIESKLDYFSRTLNWTHLNHCRQILLIILIHHK